MRQLDLRRVGQYVLVLVAAVTLNFLLPRLMPGNPLALIAGVDVGLLTQEQRAAIVADAGLDQPLLVQYLRYWEGLLTGNLGFSYRSGQPIADLVADRLPWTLLLTLSALLVSAVVGTVTGALAAWRRGRASDVTSLTGMIALESMPPFWLGMLGIAFFSVTLGVLPSFGAQTAAADLTGAALVADIARHAVLPVATLAVVSTPGVHMTMRYSMLEVLGEDFVRTARAKGAGTTRVLFRHVARGALSPVLTVLALRLGFAFGGTVVIETVFSYPGLGRLVFEAVGGRDYPVMQAAFLVFTIGVLLANLLADLLYPVLDPRVRASS